MLEIDDIALHAAYWTQKKSGVQISLKNIEVGRVIDEFSSKTLIPQKSLSSLYTKCVQFFCDPLYSFAHAMRVKWWYHAKFQHFQNSCCSDFQFHGHLAV